LGRGALAPKPNNFKLQVVEMVYFIQVKNGGPIKVGHATNPEKRFQAVQGCNHEELELITVVTGGCSLEHKIHQDLKKYNLRGEWFHPTKEVIDYMINLKSVECEKFGDTYYAVLWRDSYESKTDHCPFCGQRHIHGIGDGHRTEHCTGGKDMIRAKNGTVLFRKQG
jgi:Meiotically Up-regulated Gene 113 (MUG113) protein